jgi:hypothetical protein
VLIGKRETHKLKLVLRNCFVDGCGRASLRFTP